MKKKNFSCCFKMVNNPIDAEREPQDQEGKRLPLLP